VLVNTLTVKVVGHAGQLDFAVQGQRRTPATRELPYMVEASRAVETGTGSAYETRSVTHCKPWLSACEQRWLLVG
jgi:hypothetical protein